MQDTAGQEHYVGAGRARGPPTAAVHRRGRRLADALPGRPQRLGRVHLLARKHR